MDVVLSPMHLLHDKIVALAARNLVADQLPSARPSKSGRQAFSHQGNCPQGPAALTVGSRSEMLFIREWSNAMKKSSVLIAGVALFLTTLGPTTASAGGVRVYVGPGYAYDPPRYSNDYPRYRYDRPRYRHGDDDPQGYIVYRVPKRYLRREARRYWRGW